EQVSVKLVVALSAPVETPAAWDSACAPLHPPDAVQAVASVLFHVNVEDSPLVTASGVAVNVTVGTGGAVTVTAVLAAAEPPGPEHVSVKLVVELSAPVETPAALDSACAPLHPPEA